MTIVSPTTDHNQRTPEPLSVAAALEKAPLERYVPAEKPSLVGLTRAQLGEALGRIGVPERERRMRVQQLWHWMYFRGVRSFEPMTSIARPLRAELDRHFTLARPEVAAEQVSVDGTRKWLLTLPGETPGERPHLVECVYIPEADRGTLCLSSQVGCTLSCPFCHTGTQRLVRNLTAEEIVGQILVARDRLGDWPDGVPPATDGGSPTALNSDRHPEVRAGSGAPRRMHGPGRRPRIKSGAGSSRPRNGATPQGDGTDNGLPARAKDSRFVSNIVMMGMGEPLYNFEAVRDALLIASDGDGLSLSKRRITLSTSGVVPNIARTGAEIGCMLAVSLHAVRDDLRDQLVPLNRKYPIRELLDACRSYPGLSNARRITFEYVMLKGVNDSLAEARELVRLLKGIPAKINLIPFNPWPGTNYECSDWERIEQFSEVVFNAGYASPVRTPRGRDILAACGQLKSATEKLSARERLALRAMAATD